MLILALTWYTICFPGLESCKAFPQSGTPTSRVSSINYYITSINPIEFLKKIHSWSFFSLVKTVVLSPMKSPIFSMPGCREDGRSFSVDRFHEAPQHYLKASGFKRVTTISIHTWRWVKILSPKWSDQTWKTWHFFVLNLVTTLTLSRLVRRITWYVSIHMAKSWCLMLRKFNGRLSLRMQQDVSRTVLAVFVALIPLFVFAFLFGVNNQRGRFM